MDKNTQELWILGWWIGVSEGSRVDNESLQLNFSEGDDKY